MPFQFGDLKVFTLAEIHNTTGITLQSLRQYINDGDLKARKIGRVGWCVTEAAIKEFFETGNQEKTQVVTANETNGKDSDS